MSYEVRHRPASSDRTPTRSGETVAGAAFRILGPAISAFGLIAAFGLSFLVVGLPWEEGMPTVWTVMGSMGVAALLMGAGVSWFGLRAVRCEYSHNADLGYLLGGVVLVGLFAMTQFPVLMLPDSDLDFRAIMAASGLPYLLFGVLCGLTFLLRRRSSAVAIWLGRAVSIASLLIFPFGTCIGAMQLWLSGRQDVLERVDASRTDVATP